MLKTKVVIQGDVQKISLVPFFFIIAILNHFYLEDKTELVLITIL